MNLAAVIAGPKARVATAALVGVVTFGLWQLLTPPAVVAPRRIAALAKLERGYYFDLAARVRRGAADDPRLGRTVAAAYGDPAGPTLGVLAGVIKFGHGPEILDGVLGGLAGAGVTLGARAAAPPGKHGGTLECGSASFGADSGSYCLWWNTDVAGIAVIVGLEPAAARALALRARNATQR